MAKQKNLAIIGTRPQLLKVDRLWADVIVNTGQHYDKDMNDIHAPKVDYNLKTTELHQMIKKLIPIVEKERPTTITVIGDTRSTYAGAVVAAYMGVQLIHYEAGMRAYEDMAEERIRKIVDSMADHHLCTDDTSINNLRREGIDGILVGDVEFDRLFEYMPLRGKEWSNKYKEPYYLVTLHRAELTDSKKNLASALKALEKTGHKFIFPIHPRTQKAIKEFKLKIPKNVEVIKPLPHKELVRHILHAEKVVTDSGGVQREAVWLMKPVVIVRNRTEHTWIPINGQGILTGYDTNKIAWAIDNLQINHVAPEQRGDAHRQIANFIKNI